MENLKIFVERQFGTNSYLVFDQYNCVIIDPSLNCAKINDFISMHNLTPLAILLTHCHYDHIGDSFSLAKQHQIKIYAHKKEKPIIEKYHFAIELDLQPNINLNDVCFYEQNKLVFGNFIFDILLLSGHTPGGVSIKYQNYVFSGDTIFYDSIGRTDLKLSNADDIHKSIIKFLETYENKNIIYPGHGPCGTLEEIKKNNPFFKNKFL